MLRSRSFALAIATGLVALLAVAPSASAGLILPESGGSPNADEISSLYEIVLYIAIAVFLLVEGTLIYSLVRYRRSRNVQAAQIRGNTRLELAWTAGATLIVIVLAVITFVKLPDIQDPPNSNANGFNASNGVLVADSKRRLPPDGKSLNICVNGQQYVWRYTYADSCTKATENVSETVFSYQEMVVPVGTTVTLDIEAQDVAHSWWIPKLGGKFDAIPGVTNHSWFKIPEDQAGTLFKGQCAELCGRNHANMTAQVRALTVPDFEKWFARQKTDIKAANVAAQAQREKFEGATP